MTAAPAVLHRKPGERGHGVRHLRNSAAMTATDVALALGVRPSTVYNWEHGRCRVPEHHLAPLARALGRTIEQLRDELRACEPAAPTRTTSQGLALLRRRSGLTRRAAALRLGVSIEVLGRWEREGPPSWFALRQVAQVYGVRVDVAARAVGSVPPRVLDPRTWRQGDLPQVLRVLRSWSGLTQRELAARLGCSPDAVRGWEASRGVPSPELRCRIEAACGLEHEALVRCYPWPDGRPRPTGSVSGRRT